ncbi:hypothetical protein Fmac_003364 [Flemingia macrophylla]|uniref:Uncharacterized protein n=1 Tax=Flemingia macrophylla TaxID=520843 RepID=A0ABD1NMJ9_9FABA
MITSPQVTEEIFPSIGSDKNHNSIGFHSQRAYRGVGIKKLKVNAQESLIILHFVPTF